MGSEPHTKRREAHTGLLCALLFVSIGLNISDSVPTPTPESNLGAPEGSAEPFESYVPSSIGWELAGSQHLLSTYYVGGTMLLMLHCHLSAYSSPF